MKKRLLSWLLTAAMTVSMVPTTMPFAFAADGAAVTALRPAASGGEGVKLPTSFNQEYEVDNLVEDITIAQGGVYKLSGTNDALSVIVTAEEAVTLVLNNLTLSNDQSPIQLAANAKVTLVLPKDSVNTLTCTADTLNAAKAAASGSAPTSKTAGINVPQGASLTIDRDAASTDYGTLTVTGGYGGAGIGGGAGVGLNDAKKGNNAGAGNRPADNLYGNYTATVYNWTGTLGTGGHFGNDAESAGSITINSGKLTIRAGSGAAGIGGGRGADGEDATASITTTRSGGSENYNRLEDAPSSRKRIDTSDDYQYIYLSGGGSGTGGASGANGGTGGNAGDGGTVVITGGELSVAGSEAPGIGGGKPGAGGKASSGNGGSAAGNINYGGHRVSGSNGGRGQDGYSYAGKNGNGGSLEIQGGKLTATGTVSVGAGPVGSFTGGGSHNAGRGGDQRNVLWTETGRLTKQYMSRVPGGGFGGTVAAPQHPGTGTAATIKINSSTDNILLPGGWDGNSQVNTRPVDKNSDKLYKTEITVTRLDGTTICADADINLVLHRGDGARTYTYTTRTNEKGVATLWLPVSTKKGTTGEVKKDYQLYAEGNEVAHRAVGRIMPDVAYGIEVKANDNNQMKIAVGVDFDASATPNSSKVYRSVDSTTYALKADDDKGVVQLVIDGRTVPEDMNITKLRWFRESINGNSQEYDFQVVGNKKAFEEGFKTAAAANAKNAGSSDPTAEETKTVEKIDMKPEQGEVGKKSRVWSLPMKENGRYWVELTYQAGTETPQKIVKGVVINNIYTNYPLWVRGFWAMGNKAHEPLSWLYGNGGTGANWKDREAEYVRLLGANKQAQTQPYGIPWDLDGYNAEAMKNSDVPDTVYNKIIDPNSILKTNAAAGVQGGYDEVYVYATDVLKTLYNAQVGNFSADVDSTHAIALNNGAADKPLKLTLNRDYFSNNTTRYGEIVNGKQLYNKYLVQYLARDGSLNITVLSGVDEAGEPLYDDIKMFTPAIKDADIRAWDRPGSVITKVEYAGLDGNWIDITKRNDSLDGVMNPNDKLLIRTDLEGLKAYFSKIEDVKKVRFTYKKSTTDVTVKAYYKTEAGEAEKEIEGFVPYTAEATYGQMYTPRPLGITGFDCVGSNLDKNGQIKVYDPADPNKPEGANIVKYYFEKKQGNVTYQAVVKGENEGDPDTVVWSKDTNIAKNHAPELATTIDGTQVPPELKDFVKKDGVEAVITRKDGKPYTDKYDGVHDLVVTYEYKAKTKDVTIKAVDLMTDKEIVLPADQVKQTLETGKSHPITPPNLTANGYLAKGGVKNFYLDANNNNPEVIFYYMPTQKAPTTVTLYYTVAGEGGAETEKTIQVLSNEVTWGDTIRVNLPTIKGYSLVTNGEGVKSETTGVSTKYYVELTPIKDDANSLTKKVKYTKDAPVTISVELKEQGVADSDLSNLLVGGWSKTFTVEKGADATATAPSIPGYKLATMDGNTTTKKLTATDIAGGNTTITFYYEKIGVDDLVKINVKGINDADNNKVLYSYQKLVPVGAADQNIAAFAQPNLKLNKDATMVDGKKATFNPANEAVVSLNGKAAGNEIAVEFHYQSNTAKVKVLAYQWRNGKATTDPVEGFQAITFDAEIGTDVSYTAPSLPGYAYQSTDMKDNKITVKEGENANTIIFYYSKNEGLITYRAVDEANHELASYTKTLKPDTVVETDGKAPTVQNYRLDNTQQPTVTGATAENKFNGQTPVTVTYKFKKFQKQIDIVLMDDATHTQIKTNTPIKSGLFDAGAFATINAPDISTITEMKDYELVSANTQQRYILDNDQAQSVTFYYRVKDASRPTITVNLVDENNAPIHSYTVKGEWGVAMTLTAPDMAGQGYGKADHATVSVTPDKADEANTCSATFKYTTQYVTVTVNITPDTAKNVYKTAMGTAYKETYQVKKFSDYTVTAPTIAGYTLTSNRMNESWTKIDGDKTVTFNYDEVNNVTNAVHTIIGKTGDRILYQFTNSVPRSADATTTTPYTATDITGYTVENPNQSLPNNGPGTITFVYTTNDATVKVIAVDEEGHNIDGIDPVVYAGYEKGETNVVVRALHANGYYLVGHWNDTTNKMDNAGIMTYTIPKLDSKKSENVVKFVYAKLNDKVSFVLHCADDNQIIKVVKGEVGTAYSPKANGQLDLTNDGFVFDANNQLNDKPFNGDINAEVIPNDVSGGTQYNLYYRHKKQALTYKYVDKATKEEIKADSVTNTNPTEAQVNQQLVVIAPQIPGYTAAELRKPYQITEQAAGVKQEIEIEYNKKSSGTITVAHVLNDGSADGKPISSYTVSVSEGEWFTASKLTDNKYTLAAGQKDQQTVQATAAAMTVTFRYDANFVTVKTFTNVSGTNEAYGTPIEVVKTQGIELTPPSRMGYVLKGIKVVTKAAGGDTAVGGENNFLNVNYFNNKVSLANLSENTEVYYYYQTFNEAIPKYQVKIKVVEKYEFFTLREDTYTVDKADDAVKHEYAYNTYNGYKLKSFTIDGVAGDMTENFTGAQVAHDQNHTITYTYVLDNGSGKDDNKVVVPGPDGKIPTGDDVTIKPTNPDQKPTVDKDTGTVTVPDGGATVVTPNGTVVVPGGSTIDKNGTIKDPNGNVIKPGQPNGGTNPDDNNVKYYFIQYLANGGVGESYTQMVKKGEPVELKTVASLFTRKGHTATGWNTSDVGLGDPYSAGAHNITQNLVLYAQWKADEVPTGKNTATVELKSNGASDTVSVNQTIASDTADPILATLQGNPFTVKADLAGWTFRGWNTALDGSGAYYADKGTVSVEKDGKLTLYAQWAKNGTDGSITVPGKDNIPGTPDDVTVKPGNGGKLDRDDNGTITVPGTGGSAVKKDNEIDMPNGGTVKPNGEIIIKQPDGSTITIDKDGNASSDKEGATVFCVTYNSGDAGLKPVKVYSTSSVTVSKTVFTREGYVFGYWMGDAGTVNVGTELTTNTTLTAHWYAQGEDGSITVPGTDGKDVIVKPTDGAKPEVKDDGTVTIPGTGPIETPDGSVKVPEGSLVKPGGSVVAPDGEKLYPTVNGEKPNDMYIKVTYKSGIDGVQDYVQLVKGTQVSIIKNNVFGDVSGKTFLYWKDADGKEFTADTVTADTVLTAQWKKTGSVILSVADGSKVKQVELNHKNEKVLTMYGSWTGEANDKVYTIPVLVDGRDAQNNELRWYVETDSYKTEFDFKGDLDSDDIVTVNAQTGEIRVKNSGIVRIYCESVADSSINLSFVLVVPGDVNRDGIVDMDDSDLVSYIALGDIEPDEFQKLLGKVDWKNADKPIDMDDASYIDEIALGDKEI